MATGTTYLHGLHTRLLTPHDAPAFAALRLRGLELYPLAFTSSAQAEALRPLGWAANRLAHSADKPHDFFVGAFERTDAGEVLIGQVGVEGRYRAKERHNATVVAMVVAPEFAGRGVGAALMQHLLAHARSMPTLLQLDLTVSHGNPAAQGLYARMGFRVWGVLPGAICVNGEFVDKVHMQLPLRALAHPHRPITTEPSTMECNSATTDAAIPGGESVPT